MSAKTFMCDAIYRGSQIVEGAVSTVILASLADLILNEHQRIKGYAQVCIDKLPRGERCQLQIDEERLRVSSSRKDEGFESDSENSSASSTSSFEETLCASPEIKVINDHVLRLEKLIRQDSGIERCASQTSEDGGSLSLSSSSGAESEEEVPKRRQIRSQKETTSINQLKAQLSHQVENGNDFLMSDILFCHVLSHLTKIVIVVVKSIDTNLIAAHIFECLSSEAAKTLYGCYYTASNKYKLDKYRMSRRRGESAPKKDKIQVSIKNVRKETVSEESESKIKVDCNYLRDKPCKGNGIAIDTSNINVIEIKGSRFDQISCNTMLQRVDENEVTHIEIESAPSSLSIVQDTDSTKPSLDSFKLLSALDRLSLHSTNNPDSYLNFIGVTSSCPNSLIQTSREILSSADRERKSRQREPPQLLKKSKMTELPKREERRHRSRSEESKREKVANVPVISAQNTLDKSLSKKLIPKADSLSKEAEPQNIERQSRPRSTSRPHDSRNRQRSSHNKRPAPPPPPRRHPSNPSLMLVPTKSGQENTRAYYPKESHITRGSKVVRIDYPLYPPWNIKSDMNNNQQMMFYSNRGWYGPHEFHSNRRNDQQISVEMRKRSRSKSPARRPMAHRYIDAVSTFNLTQKIKDLSGTVIQTWKNSSGTPGSQVGSQKENFIKASSKKERKMNQPLTAAHFVTNKKNNFNNDVVRSVIKKGKKAEPDTRRVTFSAYATVQLMDSYPMLSAK